MEYMNKKIAVKKYRIERFEELDKEKKLIIYLSRLTFTEDIIREIENLVKSDINWFEFYKYALYHKVVTLCWKNVKKLVPDVQIPKYLNDIINYIYLKTYEGNQLYQLEIRNIVESLMSRNIYVIPVKGAYLIPSMYEDLGVRYSGDADFLIRHADLDEMEKTLKGIGYIKGKYNPLKKIIEPISRKEEIIWKTFMSNDFPLRKITNKEIFPCYKLDFRFALDDSLCKKPINEILNLYIKTNIVKPAYYLIHLCSHFFDEAKHSAHIFWAKDMNIIKLCDIREYIIKFTTNDDLLELIHFAKKYSLTKQVYYTMYFLFIIYNDGYEEKVMTKLGIEEDDFLYEYGDNTLNDNKRIEIDIFERVFSCGNMDKLETIPKFFLL